MLTSTGVKLLDFGLARLVAHDTEADASDAPTKQKDLTDAQTIIGTLQYMAPEQLESKPTDARTDIFAFGVLLFEMVTGRRAFEGDSQASLISAIMTARVPSVTAIQTGAPRLLDHVLERCVAKEPLERWQSMSDVRHELEWAASRPLTTDDVETSSSTRVGALAMLAVASAGLAAGMLLSAFLSGELDGELATARVSIGLSGLGDAELSELRLPTVTPDGSSVVFAQQSRRGRQRVYVRRFDSQEPRWISDADAATDLFVSPDGEWLGFNADARLQKVPITGGPPVVLSEVGHTRGAVWAEDGTIVFGSLVGGLGRVSANGGEPDTVTSVGAGESGHWWPQLVPGTEWALFTVWKGSFASGRIEAVSLETGERKDLGENGITPFYAPSGHLVFGRNQAIWAAPFDTNRMELLAPARSVEDRVFGFSVSTNGTLVYLSSTLSTVLAASVVEVGRSGAVVRQLTDEPLEFPRTLRLSPDGRSVGLADGPNMDGDLWIFDREGRPPRPLVYDGHNLRPVFSPDGDRIVFSSASGGPLNLFTVMTDGSSDEPRPVVAGDAVQQAWGWTPDGSEIIYGELAAASGWDLFAVALDGDGERVELVATEYDERQARLSRSGRWLAYVSNVTGANEIWVRPYRGSGSAVRVSPAGGNEPVWSHDDRELYYLQGRSMMAVPVERADEFRFEAPELLFEGRFHHDNQPSYDVTPDGSFLMLRQADDAPERTIELQVVLGWGEELKRLAPIGE